METLTHNMETTNPNPQHGAAAAPRHIEDRRGDYELDRIEPAISTDARARARFDQERRTKL